MVLRTQASPSIAGIAGERGGAGSVRERGGVRITRLRQPGGGVIRKEALEPQARELLRHERAILHRLAGLPGVVSLAPLPAQPGVLLLRDVAGAPLADRMLPLDVSALLPLARNLARVLAGVHARGVTHRDLTPDSIVLSEHEMPYLIDFSRATIVAETRPEFTYQDRATGSLPYLAPEQTGRMGRPVDQRADLYALGAVLYELATGAAPFGTGDPWRLSHEHLTRVPEPPARLRPQVPAVLSDIIMHLLEKEPDDRYQTADGLLHDLSRLSEGATVAIGGHDLPVRLRSPSRLVGRDREIVALGAAFAAALSGERPGLLVSGPSGVGKSSLINELRPVVTASEGWFVAGTYDPYRRDEECDGVWQAFRTLGRLLLAEPDQRLAGVRDRILHTVGTNVGLVAAILPEFATLLGVDPEPLPDEPLANQARAQRAAIDLLRAVASRERPVVFVVDDLQWAPRASLELIDQVLSGEAVAGLMLVGAYRDGDGADDHPQASMLSRWAREGDGPVHLRLSNLPLADLTSVVAEILRLDPERAATLAAAVAPRTRGNPYDTVELLNALRRDGVLVPTGVGWRWDPDTLRERLGGAEDPTELPAGRISAMPPRTRALLEAMACLGGRVDQYLLGAATGLSAGAVERRLALALADGLLVMALDGRDAVSFRHDRVREAVLRRLGPDRERAVRLRLARKLAEHPDLPAAAAQQYLPVADAVTDPAERRRVAALFRHAAEAAKLVSHHTMVVSLLTAALPLMDPGDTGALVDVHTARHSALFSLGRLADADEVYRTIGQLAREPLARTRATLVQVSSLTNRGRTGEALALGLSLLRELAVAVPAPERLDAEVDRGVDAAYRWVRTPREHDLRQLGPADPTVTAVAALINRILPSAFFHDQPMYEWLSVTALRMWAGHGPGRTLVGPASHVPSVLIMRRGDHGTAREVLRRVIAVGEEQGWEPATSQAHFIYALDVGHWFEPLEDTVALSRRAREGLIRGGDRQTACYTYYVSLPHLLEYAPTLDSYAREVDEALAFAMRTGNDAAADAFRPQRQLVNLLRGAEDRQRTRPDTVTGNRSAVANFHVTRALAAAVLGDQAELERQTSAAMPLMRHLRCTYPATLVHLLRGLALAQRVRAAGQDHPDLAELDGTIDWLAARAGDAPDNLFHLLRLLEAERAWATGDLQVAVQCFDSAVREASARRRPWHRALILERAGLFHRAVGAEYTGYGLLAEARRAYQAWGATAKVTQLDWAFQDDRSSGRPGAGLEPVGGQRVARSRLVSGTADLRGVLDASRALSSETTVEGLRARVVEILSTMTGATGVHLLLRESDRSEWLLATADHGNMRPVDDAGDPPPVPMSVVWYAERIREPVAVADATRDDRFARDPYLADLDHCSLLAVPILDRGDLRAMLLLENRLLRGAFSAERLDAVTLVAGQLAVSLNNVMMYSSLERKVAERTEELAVANRRLELLSTTDALTGLSNRRRLEEVLDVEWRRARHTGTLVAIAMVDVDHFKLYNDHYGHAAGDRALQRVAGALRRTVRDIDLVARFGGEEFAIVMPDADVDVAARVAGDLHAAITAMAEPHESVAGRIVTISIGVAATVPPPSQPPEHLIELADVELYRAKRAGGNRVRVARTAGGPEPDRFHGEVRQPEP